MINCFNKALHLLSPKQKISLNTQQYLRARSNMNLHCIPFMHFSSQKKQKQSNHNDCINKIFVEENQGLLKLNENITSDGAIRQFQQEILQMINNFEMQSNLEQAKVLTEIVSFFQIYMEFTITNDSLPMKIDQKIYDFVDEEFGVMRPFQQNFNDFDLLISSFQIQAKIVRSFKTMELDEKIQLYQLYQKVHKRALGIIDVSLDPKTEMHKIQTHFYAQTFFIYLAQNWVEEKKQVFSPKKFEFLEYAFDSLIHILHEVDTANVDDETKMQHQLTVVTRIFLIFSKFEMYQYPELKKFLLKALIQTNQAVKKFEKVTPLGDYVEEKLDIITGFIKLGEFEQALNPLFEIHALREKEGFRRNQIISCCVFLYYCIKKNSAKMLSYDVTKLLKDINNQDFDEQEQTDYELLVLMHNLHTSIVLQQYEEIEPIFIEIEEILHKTVSYLIQFIAVPFLSELMIFSLFIPTRQNQAQLLLEYFEILEYSEASHYQKFQSNFLQIHLKMVIADENQDYSDIDYSSEIIQLFKDAKNDELIQNEIILGVFRLYPRIKNSETCQSLLKIFSFFKDEIQKVPQTQINQEFLKVIDKLTKELLDKYANNS